MSNDDSGFPTAPNDGGTAPGYSQQPPPMPDYGQAPPPPGYDQAPPTPDYGQTPPPPPGYDPAPPTADYGQAPPPPGYGQQPAYGQQQPGAVAPPGYVPAGASGMMVRAPRPKVKVGAILILVGSAISILGVFLPWASANGASANGMDDYFWIDDFTLYDVSAPGTVPIVMAVIMAGFGITLLLAGRVLAVAILAIIGAVIAAIVGVVMWGLMLAFSEAQGPSVGIGAIVQPIAPLLSLAGAIVATSKRRKMVMAEPGEAPRFA